MPRVLVLAVLAGLFALSPRATASVPVYGPMLEGFDYPFELQTLDLHSQRQNLRMRYMDVRPAQPNGRVLVLLHGKNFCGATWEDLARTMSDAGYRVVIPDQIGFCKSDKPGRYQYSLHQLAANTHALTQVLGLERIVLGGHSMGGMLAMRYALMYPQQLERLVLINPIGLEDWLAKGVPYRTPDEWFARELKTTAEGIRRYQRATYYDGQWKPEYDRWVEMLAGMYAGDGRETVAWHQALTAEMLATQPVIHEIDRLRVPTTLLIGEKDNTALGKDAAPPEIAKTLGDYPRLAREAAARIPDATLVLFDDLGHSPHVQAPERFHRELLQQLAAD